MTKNDLDERIDLLAREIEWEIIETNSLLARLPEFQPRSHHARKMRAKIERET